MPTATSSELGGVKIGSGLSITNGSISVDSPGKWSDGSESGEIYYTGGNVGIGTNDPSYKLDVNGNIRTSGSLIVDGGSDKNIQCKYIVYSSYIYSNSSYTANDHLRLRSYTGGNIYMDTNGANTALTINTSQNVGIGTICIHINISTSVWS